MEHTIQKIGDCSDNEVFDDSTLATNFENSIFKDNNGNKSDIDNVLSLSALSSDRETIGYDKITGKTWIYPTNYPVRDYQFNIIKAAILKNTLVSLPTGLGKTFIAAVIMYNFYRWYPMGKIIFTAPTKPLVAQQIDACYNIVAIPPADTVEMTGHMQVNTRKTQWETKRVFFATPQVIDNDIKSGICPGDKIRCLVIDEAHKARGNYAYCHIISSLANIGHTLFRVLALSATPGSKVEDVITIIKNLNIAHLELRTETSKDVEPYCHARKINTVIVELGPELTYLRQQYVEILDVYARRLKQLNILPQNVGNLSKGRIVMMYKEFQNRERGARHPKHSYIMKDFTFLIALYHGLELLVKHGSRVFLNFFDEHPEKSWIQSDQKLMAFLDKLRNDLGINPLSLDRSILPDGTIPEMPKNLTFGHPKFDKLKEIMLQHFNEAKQKGEETKAIVFCEYRESVNLVHCLLLQCRPLIVPQMFVGQGTSGKERPGASQRQQARALRGFRAGASNALVCTCVAEEGLDVGAVDLILCFDVSTRSPVRLVQRCGRTGRSRGGHVYILVTEGREHQVLLDSMRQRDGLNFSVLRSKEVQDNLYKHNPRMLPPGVFPDCHKTYIKINKKDTTEKTTTKSKKGQKDLRAMLLDKRSVSLKSDHKDLLTKDEFEELYPSGCRLADYFPPAREYWAMSSEKLLTIRNDSKINLSTWLDNQRCLQTTAVVGHSADTEILVKLLNYNSTKEDVLAETQGSYPASLTPNVFSSPAKTKIKKKQKKPTLKSPFKKDGDIRAIFSTATKSTKSYTKLINELGIHNDGRIPTKLINIFVDLSVENKNMTKTCWTCHNICDCKIIQQMRNERDVPLFLPVHSEPYLPNISLIDDFDRDLLIEYGKTSSNNVSLDCDINNVDIANNEEIEKNLDSKLCTLESEGKNIINNTRPDKNIVINFDIGDVEDIFADSSSEDTDFTEQTNIERQAKNTTKNDDEDIKFFHLNSIEDLFEDSDSDSNIKNDKGLKSPNAKTSDNRMFDVKPVEVECDVQCIEDKGNKQNVYPTSPSILSGIARKSSVPTSPILGSQTRKFKLSIKKDIQSSTPKSAKKRLDMSKPQDAITASPKEIPESCEQLKDISSKSMLTITQTIDFINRTKNNSTIDSSSSHKALNNNKGVHENERSSSPILLTQRDRRKNSHTIDSSALKGSQVKQTSLVILDSDSDSDFELNTQELKQIEIQEKSKTEVIKDNKSSPIAQKSKQNDEDSPYFSKKLKLTNDRNEATTLQKKILAALTSNKFNTDPLGDKDSHVNFMVKSPLQKFGKENKHNLESPKEEKDNYETKSNVAKLQMYEQDSNFIESPLEEKCNNRINNRINSNIAKLQIYRRDSSVNGKHLVGKDFTNTSTPVNGMKRKLTFSDSDDDFESSEPRKKRAASEARLPNHNMRKKKKKNDENNEFLELEAELSGDGSSSGDELSDDSVGSIIDFICDDSAALHEDDDMHAHYLKSVKSPVKGVFKIPQLPDKFNKREILSQTWVENDTYEMDSFCVDDSNIGLTQANEMSELEVAEMILEERRRKRRSLKNLTQSQANGDSPLFRRKLKTVRKQIESDSDDSS